MAAHLQKLLQTFDGRGQGCLVILCQLQQLHLCIYQSAVGSKQESLAKCIHVPSDLQAVAVLHANTQTFLLCQVISFSTAAGLTLLCTPAKDRHLLCRSSG